MPIHTANSLHTMLPVMLLLALFSGTQQTADEMRQRNLLAARCLLHKQRGTAASRGRPATEQQTVPPSPHVAMPTSSRLPDLGPAEERTASPQAPT